PCEPRDDGQESRVWATAIDRSRGLRVRSKAIRSVPQYEWDRRNSSTLSRTVAVCPASMDVRRMYKGCTALARSRSHLSLKFKIGSGTEIRTPNLAVNSRLLYRLSYPGSEMEF